MMFFQKHILYVSCDTLLIVAVTNSSHACHVGSKARLRTSHWCVFMCVCVDPIEGKHNQNCCWRVFSCMIGWRHVRGIVAATICSRANKRVATCGCPHSCLLGDSDGKVGYGILPRSAAVHFCHTCICTLRCDMYLYSCSKGKHACGFGENFNTSIMFFNVHDGDGTTTRTFLLPDLVTQQTCWEACGSVWCTDDAQTQLRAALISVWYMCSQVMRFSLRVHLLVYNILPSPEMWEETARCRSKVQKTLE